MEIISKGSTACCFAICIGMVGGYKKIHLRQFAHAALAAAFV